MFPSVCLSVRPPKIAFFVINLRNLVKFAQFGPILVSSIFFFFLFLLFQKQALFNIFDRFPPFCS